MYSSLVGSFPASKRRWVVGIEKSQDNVGYVPAIEGNVDYTLPTLAVDPLDPAGAIVIPAGRFVGVGYKSGRGGSNFRYNLSDTSRLPITLADGKNVTPAGMSTKAQFKNTGQFANEHPAASFKKGFHAQLPFVLSVNNAHGTLQSGDYLAPYWGSTTSTSNQVSLHTGKPVKWFEKKLYTASSVASANIVLSSAIYPGITPRVISSRAANSLITTVTAALQYNGSNWVVNYTGTGSATVTEVWYEYGQGADQIAGELFKVESITSKLLTNNFLKWVEYAAEYPMDFPPMGPAMQRYPVTQVLRETPTTVVEATTYRIANAPNPISVNHVVLVEVSNASITHADGVTASYATGTWYPLPAPTNSLDNRGGFAGTYHSVNWRTGVIEITPNVTAISGTLAVRISYAYQTNPRDGAAIWGGGLIFQTDGSNIPIAGASTSPAQTDYSGNTVYPTPSTPAYGTSPNLNFEDVVGALDLWVK